MSDAVYITGIVLQALGGLVALLQVRWAPYKLPWLLIAISALLIVYRRAATLGEFIRADRPLAAAEVMTLVVSLLFFIGVVMMSRVFREVIENQSTQKRQTALLSSLLDSIPDIIFIKNLEGVYLGCNDEFARHAGRPKDDIVGKTDYDLYPEEEADHYRENDAAMFELGVARHNEEWISYPDGRRVLLDTLKTPYIDSDGDVIGLIGVSRDITERKLSEQAIEKSEILYRNVIQTAMDGFWVTDMQGRFLEVNDAYCELSGYSSQELLSLAISDVEALETADDTRKHIENLKVHGEDRFETKHRRKDGSNYDIEVSALYHPLEGGRVFAFLRDISDRKQAEAALSQSEETYRALVTAMPDILMRFDRDKKHLFVSDNVCSVVGIEAKHFIGKTHRDLGFTEEQYRFWEDAIERVFTSTTPFETEFIVEGLAGPVVLNWRLVPERDEEGNVSSVLSLSRDITEQRKVEHEYQTLFREMLDGFALHEIICDDDGNPEDYRFLDVNPAFERMTGLKAEEIVGRTVLEVMPRTERYWIERYGRVALTGEPDSFENYSSEIEKHFDVSAFRPAPGQFVSIFSDISDRTKAEKELIRLNIELDKRVRERTAELETINKELDAFTYSVSHDLRAPLRRIKGFSEAIIIDYAGKLDSLGQDYLKRISTSVSSMDQLIDDLLKLSRVTRHEIEREAVDLSKLAEACIGELREREPHRRVETIIKPGLLVAGDTSLMRIALENMLENAWKYSSGSETARIELGLLKREESNIYFISDNGTGFNMAHQEKLFTAFQRLHSEKEYPGTGIGLSIVSRIITRHGGKVWADSTPGKGATFYFTIP